jgi:hypothetical protein
MIMLWGRPNAGLSPGVFSSLVQVCAAYYRFRMKKENPKAICWPSNSRITLFVSKPPANTVGHRWWQKLNPKAQVIIELDNWWCKRGAKVLLSRAFIMKQPTNQIQTDCWYYPVHFSQLKQQTESTQHMTEHESVLEIEYRIGADWKPPYDVDVVRRLVHNSGFGPQVATWIRYLDAPPLADLTYNQMLWLLGWVIYRVEAAEAGAGHQEGGHLIGLKRLYFNLRAAGVIECRPRIKGSLGYYLGLRADSEEMCAGKQFGL